MNTESIKLLATAEEIQEQYPDAVFIGGLAIAEHMMAHPREDLSPEFTHDGDFCVSLRDFGDMRDYEDVSPNRRLNKYQFRRNRFEFDVYVEHQHQLPVPYHELAAYSESPRHLRVSAMEHLLVLKARAAIGRAGSTKGAKDLRDMARLLLVMPEPRRDLLDHLLTDDMREVIERIDQQVLLPLVDNNPHDAKRLFAEIEAKRVQLWDTRTR